LPKNLKFETLSKHRKLKSFYHATSTDELNDLINDDSEQIILTLLDFALRHLILASFEFYNEYPDFNNLFEKIKRKKAEKESINDKYISKKIKEL